MENVVEDSIQKNGFLDFDVDPSLDLFAEIEKLKKEKNAVILAHFYVDPDLQDIADFLGDSLGLSQQAAETDADIILFCGVHFMGETAKILSPQKKVLIPDMNAGCSLADSCPVEPFRQYKADNPDHLVISYINCSADIKAETDIICTSTNALQIVNSLPEDQPIIFAPDKNLGRWINEKTGRNMKLWDGSCQVHEIFSLEKIERLIAENPHAKFIAHPECEEQILNLAHFVGSTTALLNFTKEDPSDTFIVATEAGIIYQMEKSSLNKTFIPAPPDNSCACNDCPYMKMNTLEKVYLTLKHEAPELIMDEELRIKAKAPMTKMLDISRELGLIK